MRISWYGNIWIAWSRPKKHRIAKRTSSNHWCFDKEDYRTFTWRRKVGEVTMRMLAFLCYTVISFFFRRHPADTLPGYNKRFLAHGAQPNVVSRLHSSGPQGVKLPAADTFDDDIKVCIFYCFLLCYCGIYTIILISIRSPFLPRLFASVRNGPGRTQ